MFRFEKLEIWKKGIEVADKMFDLADRLDEKRNYRFAEQLRSASLSIVNNIAEGSGSISRKEFKQFLNFSHRSISETANMIIMCFRRSYIEEKDKNDSLYQLEEISKMVIGFSKSL